MASNKRLFTNFDEFPGSIVNGEYHFHPLHSTNTKGDPMIWNAFVRLVTVDTAQKTYTVNWKPNIESKDMIHILPGHLAVNDKLPNQGLIPIPKCVVAQIWARSGRADMNPTENIPSFITTGKNIGRANETNVLTQALITMRSKYYKKMDYGYKPVGDNVEEQKQLANAPKPYYMMAYHKWIDKPRDRTRNIIFPAVVSIKYDGTRVQVHSINNKIYFSSRRKKLFPSKPHLEKDIKKLFDAYPTIYLDTEAYIEGANLNVITGTMTKESNKNNDVEKLTLNVFDMFLPTGSVTYNGNKTITPASSFADRMSFLDSVFQDFAFKHIYRVDQVVVNTEDEYDRFHTEVMNDNNEGTIIRNLAAPYEFSDKKEIRSYQVRKRKPRYDDKFKVVDYTEGKNGGSAGAIILILETAKGKHRFSADPENITITERKKIYAGMTRKKFNDNWLGKKMTVTYHALSDDGIPLQPKVSFKNIKY